MIFYFKRKSQKSLFRFFRFRAEKNKILKLFPKTVFQKLKSTLTIWQNLFFFNPEMNFFWIKKNFTSISSLPTCFSKYKSKIRKSRQIYVLKDVP